LQKSASLKQVLISVVLALAGALSCFLLWLGTRQVALDDAFVLNRTAQTLSRIPNSFSASLAVLMSLVTAVSIERFGARRSLPTLAGVVLGLVSCSVASSLFFAVNINCLPILISILVSAVVVQGRQLWRRDRELALQMIESTGRLSKLEDSDARSRLISGIKLLETVLNLNEAIVFRKDAEGKLVPAARLRPSTSGPLEKTRNSTWREAIGLCEQAMKENKIIAQSNPNGPLPMNVALPLRHERSTVGAILIRLNDEFEENDRTLLSSVGSQMARDLQREEAFRLFKKQDQLGILSVCAVSQKFESLYVLNGLLREQRFGMEVLGEISEGVAIARLDGSVAYVNSKLLQLANFPEGFDGTADLFQLLDRFRTDIFDEPSIAVRRVLQTGETYERELEFLDQNRTYGLRIALIKSTAPKDQGEPLCLAIQVTDLTRAKEHERLKSDMISLMSHELRTPLTSINGFAELLNAEDDLPDHAKEFVTIIANESQRLSRMINTFLAVTQLQRKDKQEVLKIPLRLDEVAREIVTTLQPVAKKRRIRLVEQGSQRIPPVAADKSLITQAMKNLVSNAIKYSPERTTVTVATSLEAEAVRVSVEDRGYGIPSEARDRVWEKFYRVVREGQEKDDESTGLGLSFVREVVEQHGGEVALETEEGRGSKFSFTLPRL
jgi:signal transduction histidine kinase